MGIWLRHTDLLVYCVLSHLVLLADNQGRTARLTTLVHSNIYTKTGHGQDKLTVNPLKTGTNLNQGCPTHSLTSFIVRSRGNILKLCTRYEITHKYTTELHVNVTFTRATGENPNICPGPLPKIKDGTPLIWLPRHREHIPCPTAN